MANRKLILAANFYGHYFTPSRFSDVVLVGDGDIQRIATEVLKKLPAYHNEPVYVLFLVGVVDLCKRSSSSKGKGLLSLESFDRFRLQDLLISVKLDLDRFNAIPVWLTTFPVDLISYHLDQKWDLNNVPGFSKGLVAEQSELVTNFNAFMDVCERENTTNRVPSLFFTNGVYSTQGVLLRDALHEDGINPKDNVIKEWNVSLDILIGKLLSLDSFIKAPYEKPNRTTQPAYLNPPQAKPHQRLGPRLDQKQSSRDPSRTPVNAGLFSFSSNPHYEHDNALAYSSFEDNQQLTSAGQPGLNAGPLDQNFSGYKQPNRQVSLGSIPRERKMHGAGYRNTATSSRSHYQEEHQEEHYRRGPSRHSRSLMDRLNNPLGNYNGPLTTPTPQRRKRNADLISGSGSDRTRQWQKSQELNRTKKARTSRDAQKKPAAAQKKLPAAQNKSPAQKKSPAAQNKSPAAQKKSPAAQKIKGAANTKRKSTWYLDKWHGRPSLVKRPESTDPTNCDLYQQMCAIEPLMVQSDVVRVKKSFCKQKQPEFIQPSGIMPARSPHANKGNNPDLKNEDASKEPYIPMIGSVRNTRVRTNENLYRMKANFTRQLPEHLKTRVQVSKHLQGFGAAVVDDERTVYIDHDPNHLPVLTYLSMHAAPAEPDCKVPLSNLECAVGHYNNCVYELLTWQHILKRKILSDPSMPEEYRQKKKPGKKLGIIARTNLENAKYQVHGDWSMLTKPSEIISKKANRRKPWKNGGNEGEKQMESHPDKEVESSTKNERDVGCTEDGGQVQADGSDKESPERDDDLFIVEPSDILYMHIPNEENVDAETGLDSSNLNDPLIPAEVVSPAQSPAVPDSISTPPTPLSPSCAEPGPTKKLLHDTATVKIEEQDQCPPQEVKVPFKEQLDDHVTGQKGEVGGEVPADVKVHEPTNRPNDDNVTTGIEGQVGDNIDVKKPTEEPLNDQATAHEERQAKTLDDVLEQPGKSLNGNASVPMNNEGKANSAVEKPSENSILDDGQRESNSVDNKDRKLENLETNIDTEPPEMLSEPLNTTFIEPPRPIETGPDDENSTKSDPVK